MEIKIGEYVRIDEDFRFSCLGIGKVKQISVDGKNIYVDMCINSLPISFEIQQIVKHSKDLKELIKPCDILRYKVKPCREDIREVRVYKDARSGKEYLGVEGFGLHQIEIIEVLTKEQYRSNCFRTEEIK